MATQTIPENDGPALALSVLYEANDLLNAMRTVSEESAKPMGSAEWTLSGEVSQRLNRAIAYMDGSVPEPDTADEYQIPQVITRRDDQTTDAHLAAIKSASTSIKRKAR